MEVGRGVRVDWEMWTGRSAVLCAEHRLAGSSCVVQGSSAARCSAARCSVTRCSAARCSAATWKGDGGEGGGSNRWGIYVYV